MRPAALAAAAAFLAALGLQHKAWLAPAGPARRARPRRGAPAPRGHPAPWAAPASGGAPPAAGAWRPGRVTRRARVDGPYGVLEESPSPVVRSERPDKLFDQLVAVVQAADQKRGVDISAFWVNQGWDVVVIITALSRPQLASIAEAIHLKTKKDLRLKRRQNYENPLTIREEAASGWCVLNWPRFIVHVMTPVQRQYYDIEGTWKSNDDYEPIPLHDILREDGYGNMRIARELGTPTADGPKDGDLDGEFAAQDIQDDGTYTDAIDYEEDDDDPFWN